jgi:hypothetical protein
MSRRNLRIECMLVSLAVIIFALLFTGNPAAAVGNAGSQCLSQTAVTETMILASLSEIEQGPAANRNSSADNWMVKDAVVPRSNWIRVAPLKTIITGPCCCNSDCSSKSNACCPKD